MAPVFQMRLNKLAEHPLVGEGRGVGLIVRNIQDSVALCPPLIITTDEIHEMFDIFEKGLDAMEAWVRKENARA